MFTKGFPISVLERLGAVFGPIEGAAVRGPEAGLAGTAGWRLAASSSRFKSIQNPARAVPEQYRRNLLQVGVVFLFIKKPVLTDTRAQHGIFAMIHSFLHRADEFCEVLRRIF